MRVIRLIHLGLLCLVCVAAVNGVALGQGRDLYSDTWTAVDDLGRELPDTATVGRPKPDRALGMFYFLTFDRGGNGPYNNSAILKQHPEALNDIHHPAWGPINEAHYWGQPLFGYYASDDEWVLRKHAQVLASAGVDVVIFDNSNNVTYDRARQALCRIWADMRRHGDRTPQISFLCPFGNPAGIGSSTLLRIYETLYEPGLYQELWYRWQGKPLIMAHPSYADPQFLQAPGVRQPSPLASGASLGEQWTADRPIVAIGGEFPTWATTDSGMTLSLYDEGPGGKLVLTRKFTRVKDNQTLMLESPTPLPAGKYYLEMSDAVGQVGWWGLSGSRWAGAYENGAKVPGARSLSVRYVGSATPTTVTPAPPRLTQEEAVQRADKIRNFFTFRTPIAPYDIANPPRGGWAWLQNYPQAPQLSPEGKVEQITVGVAQNYNSTTHLAPMSFPGAYGRSYHQGKRDSRADAVRHGLNFQEQWDRALEVSPPFIFVTGWNEWTAGFSTEWSGYKAPPVIFVDEFDQEFSRDIEPMRGGHGDDYYYQFVANARRYKGARSLPSVAVRTIRMEADAADWADLGPEYRDYAGDTAHRRAPAVGHEGVYLNTAGRNDIVAAKIAFDSRYVYFYVRTAERLTPHTDADWMLLYLNTDANVKTGWLGYDYVINRTCSGATSSIERSDGGGYHWRRVGDARCAIHENELQIAVPRPLIGLDDLPEAIDFKWADHCYAKGDWTDFTLNGDAAPDDRFNYRAWFRQSRTAK